MNIDFAYCKGRFWESNKVEMTNCPMRKTCKHHIPVVGDNHFVVSSIPPEHDYICWVNPRECAKRDYILYLKDDEKKTNMRKFEIKTCGTCICFMKSSCAYPTSVADSCACSKYQEAYYTLSATSQTTGTSTSITKEENKLKHSLISVYKVNDKCIVAKSVEDAIRLYKDAYEWPYNTVKTVTLIEENAWIKSDKDDEKSE